jgi:hypothetical protein
MWRDLSVNGVIPTQLTEVRREAEEKGNFGS